MAIRSDYIDPTDERITEVMCYGCFTMIWVEKGSDCHKNNKCTSCLDRKSLSIGKKLIIK